MPDDKEKKMTKKDLNTLRVFTWTSLSAPQKRQLWIKVGESLNQLYFSLSYIVSMALTDTGKTADELTANDIRRTTNCLIDREEK